MIIPFLHFPSIPCKRTSKQFQVDISGTAKELEAALAESEAGPWL